MRAKLRPEEKVIYKTMKHWFCLVPSFFAFAAALFLFFTLPSVAPFSSMKGIIGLGVLASFAYLIYAYYERKFNLWIVTNMRVIDEWGVFSRNSKESPLEKINNASYRQSLTGRIFGFGDVIIQTAAESGETVFPFVDDPKILHETITTARSDYMQGGSAEAFGERTAPLGDTKACPMCAERVKAEALKCRFCGHMFAVAEVKADHKPEQPSVEVNAAEPESEPNPEPKLKEGFNPRKSWSKR